MEQLISKATFGNEFSIDFSNRMGLSNNIPKKNANKIAIYTDGSKLEGRVDRDRQSYFKEELLAISQSAIWNLNLLKTSINNAKLPILFTNSKRDSGTVNNASLLYIGHCDNKRADKLAGAGTVL